MNYKGYKIEHDRDHYIVIAPDGSSWTEDTVKDAKKKQSMKRKINNIKAALSARREITTNCTTKVVYKVPPTV